MRPQPGEQGPSGPRRAGNAAIVPCADSATEMGGASGTPASPVRHSSCAYIGNIYRSLFMQVGFFFLYNYIHAHVHVTALKFLGQNTT